MSHSKNRTINRRIEALGKQVDRLIRQRAEMLASLKGSVAYERKCRIWEEVHLLELRIESRNRKIRRLTIERDGEPQGLLWDFVPGDSPKPAVKRKGGPGC